MMKLENIGFYTLNNERAKNASSESRLQRCELIITSKCNFKCPYCRGTEDEANITFKEAKEVIDIWAEDKLKNIRFSGGEPTMVTWLIDLIKYSKLKGIEGIAISTNGSASTVLYDNLIEAGINDFSISLDACCSSDGDIMAGGIIGSWQRVVSNIKHISAKAYTTVGIVLTKDTIKKTEEIIKFASDELHVSDIRIITSAQWNGEFDTLNIPKRIIKKHPILEYRLNNILKGRGVRGISTNDNQTCPLVLDDMAVKAGKHYPCIIKMREGCDEIGKVSDAKTMRMERLKYYESKITGEDIVCKNNCLDVCVDYNNMVAELNAS